MPPKIMMKAQLKYKMVLGITQYHYIDLHVSLRDASTVASKR